MCRERWMEEFHARLEGFKLSPHNSPNFHINSAWHDCHLFPSFLDVLLEWIYVGVLCWTLSSEIPHASSSNVVEMKMDWNAGAISTELMALHLLSNFYLLSLFHVVSRVNLVHDKWWSPFWLVVQRRCFSVAILSAHLPHFVAPPHNM